MSLFRVLFMKELRDCRVIAAWACGVMLLASVVLLRIGNADMGRFYTGGLKYHFLSETPLSPFLLVLFGVPSVLGVALAIRQF